MFDVCVVYLLRDRHVGAEIVTEVLLGEKLTGLGVGKLVGAGGKLEPGESARTAAVREVDEELGVDVVASDLVAISDITYPFVDRDEWSQRSFGFVTRTWTGTPTGSDELAPHWFPIDAIPFDRMWADARLWLPRAFAGEFVDANYSFRADGSMADSS
ncbi:MAG: 8-oxo-dGTP diphosphatase [Microbacteriaceae bacterium]|nr:8-oxo-dGTP diphosphatase [Microbacteriaceae bacterium]